MKPLNHISKRLAAGALSLAVLGAVGLQSSAMAAGNPCSCSASNFKTERQQVHTMREKMFTQAKADDAQLEGMIAELNRAPESKKPQIEAALLNKLVEQHHQMLTDWETVHARVAQLRAAHQGARAETGTPPTAQR